MLKDYKQTSDKKMYTRRYYDAVLMRRDSKVVVEDLNQIAKGRSLALICYEAPNKFCHRHLVAVWLSRRGIIVEEFDENEYSTQLNKFPNSFS